MRKFVLFAFLVSMTWGIAGCGDSSSSGPPADSGTTPGSPNVPGVPTEGPEAAKAGKGAKRVKSVNKY